MAGHDELARRLKVPVDQLPDAAAALDDERAALLAELVREAVVTRGVEMERAVEDGLTLVPRPLRKPVMKILGL